MTIDCSESGQWISAAGGKDCVMALDMCRGPPSARPYVKAMSLAQRQKSQQNCCRTYFIGEERDRDMFSKINLRNIQIKCVFILQRAHLVPVKGLVWGQSGWRSRARQ